MSDTTTSQSSGRRRQWETGDTGGNGSGLVGQNDGTIEGSKMTGTVGDPADASIIGSNIGGLVGANTGLVTTSKALGTFDGDASNVGSLVGHNDGGMVRRSYATISIDTETVQQDAKFEVAAVSSSEGEQDALKTALDNGLSDAGELGTYIGRPESTAAVTGRNASDAVDQYDVFVVNDFGEVRDGERRGGQKRERNGVR